MSTSYLQKSISIIYTSCQYFKLLTQSSTQPITYQPFQIFSPISPLDYASLQQSVQKAQAQIRKHIRIEQQLKIYMDSLEEKLEWMERDGREVTGNDSNNNRNKGGNGHKYAKNYANPYEKLNQSNHQTINDQDSIKHVESKRQSSSNGNSLRMSHQSAEKQAHNLSTQIKSSHKGQKGLGKVVNSGYESEVKKTAWNGMGKQAKIQRDQGLMYQTIEMVGRLIQSQSMACLFQFIPPSPVLTLTHTASNHQNIKQTTKHKQISKATSHSNAAPSALNPHKIYRQPQSEQYQMDSSSIEHQPLTYKLKNYNKNTDQQEAVESDFQNGRNPKQNSSYDNARKYYEFENYQSIDDQAVHQKRNTANALPLDQRNNPKNIIGAPYRQKQLKPSRVATDPNRNEFNKTPIENNLRDNKLIHDISKIINQPNRSHTAFSGEKAVESNNSNSYVYNPARLVQSNSNSVYDPIEQSRGIASNLHTTHSTTLNSINNATNTIASVQRKDSNQQSKVVRRQEEFNKINSLSSVGRERERGSLKQRLISHHPLVNSNYDNPASLLIQEPKSLPLHAHEQKPSPTVEGSNINGNHQYSNIFDESSVAQLSRTITIRDRYTVPSSQADGQAKQYSGIPIIVSRAIEQGQLKGLRSHTANATYADRNETIQKDIIDKNTANNHYNRSLNAPSQNIESSSKQARITWEDTVIEIPPDKLLKDKKKHVIKSNAVDTKIKSKAVSQNPVTTTQYQPVSSSILQPRHSLPKAVYQLQHASNYPGVKRPQRRNNRVNTEISRDSKRDTEDYNHRPTVTAAPKKEIRSSSVCQ